MASATEGLRYEKHEKEPCLRQCSRSVSFLASLIRIRIR
jgi:hypothetical protein